MCLPRHFERGGSSQLEVNKHDLHLQEESEQKEDLACQPDLSAGEDPGADTVSAIYAAHTGQPED